jgi:hypothetical protein
MYADTVHVSSSASRQITELVYYGMSTFQPRQDILPAPQRTLWPELDATPDHFTLYGGTALALRLGHRQSGDFLLLAAGAAVWGREFNPLLTLRALAYFGDVPSVPGDVQERLRAVVNTVDPVNLPVLTPHRRRDNGRSP